MRKLKNFRFTQIQNLIGVTSLSVLGTVFTVHAETAEEHLACGVEQATEALYKKYPAIKEKQQANKFFEELNLTPKLSAVQLTDYTIPVVFHIIHGGGAENITDAQIQGSIDQLNEDYNGNDLGKADIFDEFKARYADVGMNFVLARLDPDGNPTDGITRHYEPLATTQYNDGSDEVLKAKYMWPREKYLNIYVVRSAGGSAGSAWAFYPGQVDTEGVANDGVISSHWAIGRSGTATPTHYKILTHEIGHWANLAHTFDNGCSAPGDNVADTPPTQTGGGCNKVWSPCGSGTEIANTQNYMDYGYCTVMFTTGQSDRMKSAMNSSVSGRNNLYTQSNLVAAGVVGQSVSALFNIEKNTLVPGGKVKFNNVSQSESSEITSWQWNFPGGSPSSYTGETPPTITYNTPGIYAATLTVSNGSDSNTVTKNDYITVTKDIVMRNDVVRACDGTFVDSGNDFAGLAGQYGNREDHTLTILPNQQNSAVQVNFNEFVIENNSNCDLDHLKVYDGLGDDAPLLGTYCGVNSPGNLVASNNAGALTFVFHSDVKSRAPGWQADLSCTTGQGGGNISPTAKINGPYQVKASTELQFNSAGSVDIDGEIVAYNWNFGDGQNSTLSAPTHIYNQTGTYTATLMVTDDSGATASQSTQVTVRVNQPDPLIVEANGPYSAKQEASVTFSSEGTNDLDTEITSYLWEFGDGNSSTFYQPSHTYKLDGSYIAKLTVTNANGETQTDTANVEITIEPGSTPPAMENACATSTPIENGRLEAGQPICVAGDVKRSFSISDVDKYRSIAITAAYGSGPIKMLFRENAWPNATTFDAQSSTIGDVECIYFRNPTEYWGYVSVEGSNSDTSVVIDFNTAGCRSLGNANILPVGVITAATHGETDKSINFSGISSTDADGSIVSYLWDFGDGSTMNTQSQTTHVYQTAGDYVVSLTVTDNHGGAHIATHNIVINDPVNSAPIAIANGPYAGKTSDNILFNSDGSNDSDGTIEKYEWDFGDGTAVVNQAKPTHSYQTAGSYTATLTVTDNGGLTHTSEAQVEITQTPILKEYCSANGGGGYEWIANVETDGFSNASDDGNYSDFTALEIPLSSGTNAISLTAGGTYTEHWKIWIDFNSDGDFNDPGEIVLNNLSGKGTVKGNMNIAANTHVTTTMRIAMKYNGEATSSCGDIGDGEVEDYAVVIGSGNTIIEPEAHINGPYSANVNTNINFSSAGSTGQPGTIVDYLWSFGDGQTSTHANPVYSYATDGNYTASLTVTNSQGNTATSSTAVTIWPVSQACGATTNTGGGIDFGVEECVNGTGKLSYWIYVEEDNTTMYISTWDGTGDVDIYYNSSTWAGINSYQYKSDLIGNNQVLQVTANKGYRYISLETDTEYADVKFIVTKTPPTGMPGDDFANGGGSVSGTGTTTADDPDCALADTPTNDANIRMYHFDPTLEANFLNSWVRVQGDAVTAEYTMKFCPPIYGNIRAGERIEKLSDTHFGKEWEYNYKHWGERDSNVDSVKVIAQSGGHKAVMTMPITLSNPTVAHPVQPSCDDLTLDADFDGIPDCAELPGKTFYTMPLYEWGARQNQQDLFIEVDYMAKHPLKDYDGNYVYDDNNQLIIDHGTEPKRATLDRVKEVYAQRGIHLHMDAGDLFDQSPGLDPADYDLGGGQAVPFMEYIHLARWTDSYNGVSIEVPGMDQDVMPQYFFNNEERGHIFYYVLFANSQGGANRGSSGQAPDLFDRYMYLSLGGTGWQLNDDTPENENMLVNAQASTMVHELGHIFGLSHDGFPDDQARNFKLNYPSAMNYLFQLQGGPTDKFDDVSFDVMVRERYYLNVNPDKGYACNPMLRETHPDNTTWGNLVHGLRSDPADFHIGYSDGLQPKIDESMTSEAQLSGGLDHNCDGNIDNYEDELDVNNDGQINQLWDYNDWGYLTFFYHYYNYDVTNEYDVSNEFLLEPNYHVKWANSPTDVKYPSKVKTAASAPKKLLMSVKDKQALSKKLIGVEEVIVPLAARKELHKAMAQSRSEHRKKQLEEVNENH